MPISSTLIAAVRTFVAILLSGTPAAVNQLVVTQLYNPEGSAHTLASFLMLQCKSLRSFSRPRCRVTLVRLPVLTRMQISQCLSCLLPLPRSRSL